MKSTRRDFLKKLGIGVGAAAVAPLMPAETKDTAAVIAEAAEMIVEDVPLRAPLFSATYITGISAAKLAGTAMWLGFSD